MDQYIESKGKISKLRWKTCMHSIEFFLEREKPRRITTGRVTVSAYRQHTAVSIMDDVSVPATTQVSFDHQLPDTASDKCCIADVEVPFPSMI